jgi:hypothetical protein
VHKEGGDRHRLLRGRWWGIRVLIEEPEAQRKDNIYNYSHCAVFKFIFIIMLTFL